VNKHSQELYLKTKEISRQHSKATVDILQCLKCGYVYATLSFAVHNKKCPKCQGGNQ
jgi:predicted Zn-ribbon and HTH transcriptional regulator